MFLGLKTNRTKEFKTITEIKLPGSRLIIIVANPLRSTYKRIGKEKVLCIRLIKTFILLEILNLLAFY